MKSRLALPTNAPGMRIGLFGGSFNPPHDAHRAVTLYAMKRLRLDRVWWLVTPGNPLKDNKQLPPLDRRIEAAQALAAHPRIDVTGIEAVIGTKYSYDTIVRLMQECPQSRFVWIMGADNLKNFHRWKRWQDIAGTVPIAVIDRGGTGLSMLGSPAAQALARARIPESRAAALADASPPAWAFLHGMKLALSSTELRASKNPDRGG
jgi:nicotinate-nucleotide adenylyltransferase